MGVVWFSLGVALGIIAVALFIKLVLKNLRIFKVDYTVLLYGENNKPIRVLANFTKYYWNDKSRKEDTRVLMGYCEDIRMRVDDEDNFIKPLIDVNFEVDFTKVYLENVVNTVHPE